jgi:cytoskeletal protein CcmA (bactofilin family)
MIRMGRSSKTEPQQPIETTQFQEPMTNITSTFNYNHDNLPSSTRAISESESMARDIKEGRLSGFVGNGTVLTGETTFQAMLRVDGHLTGRVTSEVGTLVIGATGRVDANISVAAAVINGTINGDVTASERVELGRTAKVIGNIHSPRLMIEDGAVFEGSCTMLKSREAFDKRVAEMKPDLTTNDLLPLENTESKTPEFSIPVTEELKEIEEEG